MGYYARVNGVMGVEVTDAEIRAAYTEGRCLLAHSYGTDRTLTVLEIGGVERDTRQEAESMHEAVWTQRPESVAQCLQVAGS